ncbi:probable E3 ubiquitin-protein ligase RHY1A [Macadamia integrifolia]|uniref:probable E3 ubiquitin-protein ligase RHY1A n=1 Tax=Macadamia integrifolia TaxID=60698 RepID=UPI001C502548|nr:probable E3 ubiquitin-protein ligase RHY1A [Macadamia integrifolia]XP_042506871.1 probable E3 ubiquitin-protein ligase RHY1A [Macadamia integrifolia]XP_042506872.1 probable E3 ubiquitin-protein ligase RHY1A [Macadamia integrifolia]XP_042506874.1 probable E3 ubiquitin-protein ligase RHY1A [Macadamia integrifolia]XP_042506875.1 probable E3 ubiquitin-protein ligase RHY1A [Macadamia integrifolia]
MPGASELFYGRRSRIGRSTPESGGIGFSDASDRNPHHHPHHNNNSHNHRHHHSRHRSSHDVRPLCYRTFQSERESVRIENGASQSGASNDTSAEISSSRASRLRFTRNDRLPGAVLLARERLVERLRGVSLSVNRQGGRASSGISWDEFAVSDDFRLIDAGDWDTEAPRDWFPFSGSDSQVGLSSLPGLSHKKPPGLSREEVKCLHREVFGQMSISDERMVPSTAKECSICLEKFQERDLLVCLPCEHRFHSACLEPWVLTRGDCPYCRTGVIVGDHVVGTNILP